MTRAGFVLVGGASSRMGRDKALLPYRGGLLVEHIAATLAGVAGSVTLVGPPEKYAHLGLKAIPDLFPGTGPLGAICTALAATEAEWNLILACDMPDLSVAFLEELFAAAEGSAADCLLPAGPSGRPEPLCAVYHRRGLPAIRQAFDRGARKVLEALAGLAVRIWQVPADQYLANCNTPQEWSAFVARNHPLG